MHPQIYVCGDWNPQWARVFEHSTVPVSVPSSPDASRWASSLDPHKCLKHTTPVLPFHLEAESVLMEEGRVLGHRNRQMNEAGLNEVESGHSLGCQLQYNFSHLLE